MQMEMYEAGSVSRAYQTSTLRKPGFCFCLRQGQFFFDDDCAYKKNKNAMSRQSEPGWKAELMDM